MQNQEKNVSTVELARYFKVALADKNNISFENAEYILKYFAKDGIPEEVIDDACLWLKCFEEKCFTVLTEDIDNMPLFINSLGSKINGDWKKVAKSLLSLAINIREKVLQESRQIAKNNQKKYEYRANRNINFGIQSKFEKAAVALHEEGEIPIVQEMTSLADEIYIINPDNFRRTPSFVVCSSSGTGKTQLPFCFDSEILYFVLDYSQDIYCNYEKISAYFVNLLESDFADYCKYVSNHHIEEINTNFDFGLEYFTVSKILGSNIKFFSVDFVVKLIKAIIDLKKRKANSSTSWLRLQIDEDIFVSNVKITMTDAIIELEDLIKRNLLRKLPLIFFDEFNISQISTKKERATYSFFRNIIRACGIIPVLMGTDSHITHLIPTKNPSGADKYIWGYVFYKLPHFPSKLLEKKLEELKFGDENFFYLMKHLLVRERPLFVNAVLDYFKKMGSDLSNMIRTDISEIFHGILYSIRSSFYTRKLAQLEHFLFSQFSLFENAFTQYYEKKHVLMPAIIHHHLAYLKLPENANPKFNGETYFRIWANNRSLQYDKIVATKLGRSQESLASYQAASRLPLTDEEPLTCLSMSMNFSTDHCSLRTDTHFFTAFQGFYQKEANSGRKEYRSTAHYNGNALEKIVNVAYMLSTHFNELDGGVFTKWFPYFIQQLGCYRTNISYDIIGNSSKKDSDKSNNSSNEEDNSNDLDEKNSDILLEGNSIDEFIEDPEDIQYECATRYMKVTHIAFAGFNGAMWDEKLKNYLIERGFKLGSFTGARSESRDLNALTLQSYQPQSKRITRNSKRLYAETQNQSVSELTIEKRIKATNNNIIVCECKIHEDNINNDEIRNIIQKMIRSKVDSEIVLIIACEFVSVIDTDYNNIRFYRLKREYSSGHKENSEECSVYCEGSKLKLKFLEKQKNYKTKSSNRFVTELIKPNSKRTLSKKSNSNSKITETSTCKNENISPKNPITVILIELVEIHGRGSHLNTMLASCK